MTQANKCHLQSEVVYNEALDFCIGGVSSTGQIFCCYISVRFSSVWLPHICLSSGSFYLSWQDAKFFLIFSTGIIIISALNAAFQLAGKWTWGCSCSHIVRWSFWILSYPCLRPSSLTMVIHGSLILCNIWNHKQRHCPDYYFLPETVQKCAVCIPHKALNFG